MNEEHITRVTREQWAKLKAKTDWEKVKGMNDAEIAKNALEDPDNPPLPADFFDEVVECTPVSLNP